MTKKENIKKKELIQLSLEFPSHDNTCAKTNSYTIKSIAKCNTPVISLLGNNFLCEKTKSNYVSLVLNNTKSF